MSELEYVEKITSVTREITETLKRIERMEHIIEYYEDMLFLNEEGARKIISPLRKWVNLYEHIERSDKFNTDELMFLLEANDFEYRMDWDDISLRAICYKWTCIHVDLKLPITSEAKSIILEKIKEVVERYVNRLNINYGRVIDSFAEAVSLIHSELRSLREMYKKLKEKYEKLLKTAGGEK